MCSRVVVHQFFCSFHRPRAGSEYSASLPHVLFICDFIGRAPSGASFTRTCIASTRLTCFHHCRHRSALPFARRTLRTDEDQALVLLLHILQLLACATDDLPAAIRPVMIRIFGKAGSVIGKRAQELALQRDASFGLMGTSLPSVSISRISIQHRLYSVVMKTS